MNEQELKIYKNAAMTAFGLFDESETKRKKAQKLESRIADLKDSLLRIKNIKRLDDLRVFSSQLKLKDWRIEQSVRNGDSFGDLINFFVDDIKFLIHQHTESQKSYLSRSSVERSRSESILKLIGLNSDFKNSVSDLLNLCGVDLSVDSFEQAGKKIIEYNNKNKIV